MKSQRKYDYRVAMIMKNKKLDSHSQTIAARKYDLFSFPLPKTALCAKICENSGDTILLHESISPQNLMKSKNKQKTLHDNSTGATIMKTCQKAIVKLLLQENMTTLVQPEKFSKA